MFNVLFDLENQGKVVTREVDDEGCFGVDIGVVVCIKPKSVQCKNKRA